MATSIHMFDKFLQETNTYFSRLAKDLGHPDEPGRVIAAWKAVMHTIRDRIHMGESFDLMSQLPMMLKGLYAENWKYTEKPRLDYDTVDEMTSWVEKYQRGFGETEFDWNKSTEEIISIVLDSLDDYLTEGQLEHVQGMMPKDLKTLVS